MRKYDGHVVQVPNTLLASQVCCIDCIDHLVWRVYAAVMNRC